MRNSGEPVRPSRGGEAYCKIDWIRVAFLWITLDNGWINEEIHAALTPH